MDALTVTVAAAERWARTTEDPFPYTGLLIEWRTNRLFPRDWYATVYEDVGECWAPVEYQLI
jgi:hypothetical protein